MATKLIELFTDDLDGSKAAETVQFAIGDTDYTIDLSAKNAARLRKQLRPYVEVGLKVAPTRRRRSARPEDTVAGRAEIRAWAWRTGNYPTLSHRGRIAQHIVDAWHKERFGR